MLLFTRVHFEVERLGAVYSFCVDFNSTEMDNHDLNRNKVCVLCLSKTKNLRPISAEVRNVIRENYLPDLEKRSWYYPSVICTSCRLVCKPGVEVKSRVLHLHKYKYDYTQLTRAKDSCKCEVCNAASIVLGHNLPGVASNTVKTGRPRKALDDTTNKVVRMCNNCLTEINRGKKHVCNSSERAENLSKILKKDTSPKAAENAVSKFLAEKASSSGNDLDRINLLDYLFNIYS